MRSFVRQSIHGGRAFAFNQFYKSKFCDDILRIISEQLNVKGKFYDIVEAYLNFRNKHLEIIKKDFESKFNDYPNDDEDVEKKFINENLSKLRFHQLMKQLKLDELLRDFDAVSLYPTAMWDENSIYPRIETVYAFTQETNDELLEKFNTGNFTQGNAILKIEFYNPKNLIVQHIAFIGKVKII